MIGVFDSGKGGMASVRVIRQILPRVNIAYLADRKNAPYGTKSQAELQSLVCEDVRRLRDIGAEKILIACCTASSVYASLSDSDREISVPIIAPAANLAARLTKKRSIAVIATEATVASSAFRREILRCNPKISVSEIACQELVGLIESGSCADSLSEYTRRISEKISNLGCDTLILGCTHFSYARDTFQKFLSGVRIVDSAAVGALQILNQIKTEENGKILYM